MPPMLLNASKIVAGLKICRNHKTINHKHRPESCTQIRCGKRSKSCKTINYNHRPGSCTQIRCGKRSEKHAKKDLPASIETLKCPMWEEAHSFNGFLHQKTTWNKTFRGTQKSYKEALLPRPENRNLKKCPLQSSCSISCKPPSTQEARNECLHVPRLSG